MFNLELLLSLYTVRFDLGSILSGFGQAANNNNNQQSKDPVADLLGGLLNQNIAVTFNDQGQIQVSKGNNNNDNQQQTTTTTQAPQTTARPNQPNNNNNCELNHS
jgi:hypothetical protein